MTKTHSGGGRTPVGVGVRAGPATTNKMNVGGASQIGQAMGGQMRGDSHTSKNSALPMAAGRAAQVPMGNAVAASTKCGPGGSRTIYPTGSQMQHGPAVPGNAPAKNV